MQPLPADFIHNIENSFGQRGTAWLATLPSLQNEAARRWDLTLGEPFLLSYNYVCAATGRGGKELILKIGVPNTRN